MASGTKEVASGSSASPEITGSPKAPSPMTAPLSKTEAATKAPEIVSDLQPHDTKTSGGMYGSSPYLPGDKLHLSPVEAATRFGSARQLPVVADEAWVASIPNFSRPGTRAEKWVLLNYKANTMLFVNTFDGFAGENFKWDAVTQPLVPKKFRQKTENHVKVAVADCPVAVTAEEWNSFREELKEQGKMVEESGKIVELAKA